MDSCGRDEPVMLSEDEIELFLAAHVTAPSFANVFASVDSPVRMACDDVPLTQPPAKPLAGNPGVRGLSACTAAAACADVSQLSPAKTDLAALTKSLWAELAAMDGCDGHTWLRDDSAAASYWTQQPTEGSMTSGRCGWGNQVRSVPRDGSVSASYLQPLQPPKEDPMISGCCGRRNQVHSVRESLSSAPAAAGARANVAAPRGNVPTVFAGSAGCGDGLNAEAASGSCLKPHRYHAQSPAAAATGAAAAALWSKSVSLSMQQRTGESRVPIATLPPRGFHPSFEAFQKSESVSLSMQQRTGESRVPIASLPSRGFHPSPDVATWGSGWGIGGAFIASPAAGAPSDVPAARPAAITPAAVTPAAVTPAAVTSITASPPVSDAEPGSFVAASAPYSRKPSVGSSSSSRSRSSKNTMAVSQQRCDSRSSPIACKSGAVRCQWRSRSSSLDLSRCVTDETLTKQHHLPNQQRSPSLNPKLSPSLGRAQKPDLSPRVTPKRKRASFAKGDDLIGPSYPSRSLPTSSFLPDSGLHTVTCNSVTGRTVTGPQKQCVGFAVAPGASAHSTVAPGAPTPASAHRELLARHEALQAFDSKQCDTDAAMRLDAQDAPARGCSSAAAGGVAPFPMALAAASDSRAGSAIGSELLVSGAYIGNSARTSSQQQHLMMNPPRPSDHCYPPSQPQRPLSSPSSSFSPPSSSPSSPFTSLRISSQSSPLTAPASPPGASLPPAPPHVFRSPNMHSSTQPMTRPVQSSPFPSKPLPLAPIPSHPFPQRYFSNSPHPCIPLSNSSTSLDIADHASLGSNVRLPVPNTTSSVHPSVSYDSPIHRRTFSRSHLPHKPSSSCPSPKCLSGSLDCTTAPLSSPHCLPRSPVLPPRSSNPLPSAALQVPFLPACKSSAQKPLCAALPVQSPVPLSAALHVPLLPLPCDLTQKPLSAALPVQLASSPPGSRAAELEEFFKRSMHLDTEENPARRVEFEMRRFLKRIPCPDEPRKALQLEMFLERSLAGVSSE